MTLDTLQAQDAPREATENTSGTLTDRMEHWEHGIRTALGDANTAVNETVQEMGKRMNESVNQVGEAVQETARTMGKAFDFPRQIRRHPWMAAGAALVFVLLVRQWLSRRD